MKRTFAAVAIAGLLGLTGCASSPTAMETSSAPKTATPTASAESPVDSAAATGAKTVKDACETFNSLYAEFAAVSVDNENGYEDIYMKAQDAQGTVSGNLVGLFASLSIIALDRASAASDGGQIEQASKDAVRDAVFANASACTAEGVTLQL
ncbi:hypothetical protein [Arthrobacter sp. N199823]|uniref:hypothetical protein n=1 Tax=unclassified Arthrobacter TaxID=235627 RepID=UPI000CE401B1|nr:hypothetical protein [Arthrobacter sp. N199823]